MSYKKKKIPTCSVNLPIPVCVIPRPPKKLDTASRAVSVVVFQEGGNVVATVRFLLETGRRHCCAAYRYFNRFEELMCHLSHRLT